MVPPLTSRCLRHGMDQCRRSRTDETNGTIMRLRKCSDAGAHRFGADLATAGLATIELSSFRQAELALAAGTNQAPCEAPDLANVALTTAVGTRR